MTVATLALIALGACVPDGPKTPTEASATASAVNAQSPNKPSDAPSVAEMADEDHWRPTGTMPWHIQYGGEMLTPEVPVFNLDGVGTSAQRVEQLHAAGARVICYVNAGASETFRDDFASFPERIQGKPLDGWPGETWLDIRELDILLPIMATRMDECRYKGFDAVDPDNMNAFTINSGFPLTKADALTYQRELIQLAHDRGLAVGLKNTMELIPELADEIDFAVNEQCGEYDECDTYGPLIALDKPVFHIEYQGTCDDQPAGLSTVIAEPALDGEVTNCP